MLFEKRQFLGLPCYGTPLRPSSKLKLHMTNSDPLALEKPTAMALEKPIANLYISLRVIVRGGL